MKKNTLILVSLAVAVGAGVFLLSRSGRAEPSPLPSPKPQPQPLPSGGVTVMPEVTITASGQNPPPAWKGALPLSPEAFKTGLTTAWVQKFLSALAKIEDNIDYDPRTLAGVWDGPTAQAVMAYQIDRRLLVDGKVGPQTATVMRADYAKYASKSPNIA